MNAFCYTKIYIKLNIITAFDKSRIIKEYKWKTVFIMKFGLFESLVMPFGFCNTSTLFQHYFNHILFDLLNKNCIPYLNDILIYFLNIVDYQNQIYNIIRWFFNIKLQIDIDKYRFETKKTKYPELIIPLKKRFPMFFRFCKLLSTIYLWFL